MAVIVDCSQLMIAAAVVFKDDMKKGQDKDKMKSIIRHGFFLSLFSYVTKYEKIPPIILAFDGKRSWRHDVFPNYKAKRKIDKKNSDLDWDTIDEAITELKGILKTIFPWKTIEFDKAEGDDVVAVMTKFFQDNECIVVGLFEEVQNIMIISSDGDFKQLHKYKTVRQWSPIQKKMVEKPEKDFLVEKIITGDSGDGVPSVLCPDDFFVKDDKTRAPSVTQKVIQRFKDGIDLTEDEQRRFGRNRQLIDFDFIPEYVNDAILEQYRLPTQKKNAQAIMDYFMANRLSKFLEKIQEI